MPWLMVARLTARTDGPPQLGEFCNAGVCVKVDVDAPGTAVAEIVAGERADQALKAGRRAQLLA